MIKTTLIGHASLLIQSKETNIVTDPVWFDYLWEEINVLCPSIDLDLEKIPPVDVLNLSHRHQDHFDVRTLVYLKKNDRILKPDVTVLAPKDDILLEVLDILGYKNVTVVTDFESIEVRDVRITPTPSLNQASTSQDYFPEHGLIVEDGEVTVWNQVDTIVSPEIVEYMLKNFARLDFAHSRFVPLLEGNFSYHKALALPFDEYCSFLNVVKALNPKFVVPGSAAFRYRDEFNFLNRYSFPTTQEQFLKDLEGFCPGLNTSMYLPGDVAHVTKEGVEIKKQSSPFVKVKEDDSEKVIFKPVMEVSPIRTMTQDAAENEREMKVIRDFIQNGLMESVRKSEMLDGWRHWQVVYQLEVFGLEETEVWYIDFTQEDLKPVQDPLNKINIYEGITASELCALIEKRTSWDFVALCGNYRTFNNVYRVTDGHFEYLPGDKINSAFEPLMDAFPWSKEMDREKFMKDVRRWAGIETP